MNPTFLKTYGQFIITQHNGIYVSTIANTSSVVLDIIRLNSCVVEIEISHKAKFALLVLLRATEILNY